MECWECRDGDRKRVWDEEGGEWAVIGFSVTYVAGGVREGGVVEEELLRCNT